jgi:hypothetical protein
LGHSVFNTGDAKKKALSIANEKVVGKSLNRIFNIIWLRIYKANNQLDKVSKMKKELQESIYRVLSLKPKSKNYSMKKFYPCILLNKSTSIVAEKQRYCR